MADSFASIAFSVPQDRRYYDQEIENPAVRTKIEGGYVVSRPRFPRKPLRRTWKTGFTDMSPADRTLLENFWNDQHGGSKVFIWLNVHEWEGAKWTNPSASSSPYNYYVRFAMEKLTFVPKGAGQNLRFDCPDIVLEEV